MEYVLKYETSNDDGVTLKEQLKQVWKTTGVKPKELADEEILNENGKYLYNIFMKLSTRRTRLIVSGMSGGKIIDAPISYTEIKSYCDLKQIQLSENELEIIESLDIAFLSHMNKKA